MNWLKNKEELFLFMMDMRNEGKIGNLDNYMKWVQLNKDKETSSPNDNVISFKLKNGELTENNRDVIRR